MLSVALALSTQAHAGILMNEMLADPGTVNDSNCDGIFSSTDDEFIEIVNTGPGQVDLSGATISDLVGVRHTFPANTVLAANRALVVYGNGTPSCQVANVTYQISSTLTLALNNSGDTITLTSAGGQVLDTYTYAAEANFDQSITRSPDLNAVDPMVQHTTVSNATMSPGTKVDGSSFGGGGGAGSVLSQPNPGSAGGNNTFSLTGAAPNTGYVLIGSLQRGQFVHPMCPNDPASMANPQIIGQAQTNAQGAAQFVVAVPAGLAGRTAYFQAAAAAVCDITPLVTDTL